jgi:hypothetical protein
VLSLLAPGAVLHQTDESVERMRLFSSFRIMPGVRISASRRGVRAHVGPRVLRGHFGGGKAGVSTGAGPFTAYGSSRKRRK